MKRLPSEILSQICVKITIKYSTIHSTVQIKMCFLVVTNLNSRCTKCLSLSLNLQCFSCAFYSKLGLGKLHISSSHHKKRLAVESRHHGRPDDSHMFVIKLPPNPYYYTNNGPVPAPNAIEDVGKKVRQKVVNSSSHHPSVLAINGKKSHWSCRVAQVNPSKANRSGPGLPNFFEPRTKPQK